MERPDIKFQVNVLVRHPTDPTKNRCETYFCTDKRAANALYHLLIRVVKPYDVNIMEANL